MFQGRINGVRLLADGDVTVSLTCQGADLQAIANSRQGTLTCYGEGEQPVTDDRVTVLANIRALAEQMARDISRELKDRELSPEERHELWEDAAMGDL